MALHLRTNNRRLEELQRLVAESDEQLFIELLREKRELLWRFRVILGGLDAFDYNESANQSVLLELCGLGELATDSADPPRGLLPQRQLQRRLNAFLDLEQRLHDLADNMRRQFPQHFCQDEFRVCAQTCDEHRSRLLDWRRAHGKLDG